LREQVEQLLLNHEQAGSFLSKPIFENQTQDVGQPGRFVSGSIVAGRFKVVRLLDKGGMGEVFEAQDLKLRRQVALKVLPQELSRDVQMLERFEREARRRRRWTAAFRSFNPAIPSSGPSLIGMHGLLTSSNAIPVCNMNCCAIQRCNWFTLARIL
jgi:serine/threonine protein kinase